MVDIHIHLRSFVSHVLVAFYLIFNLCDNPTTCRIYANCVTTDSIGQYHMYNS